MAINATLNDEMPSLGAMREMTSEFLSECIGFEFQIEGLFHEFASIYESCQSHMQELATERNRWEERAIALEKQQSELLSELQALRDLIGNLDN